MSFFVKPFPFVYVSKHILGILKKLIPIINVSISTKQSGKSINKNAIISTSLNTIIL